MAERFFHKAGRVWFRVAPGRVVAVPTSMIWRVALALEAEARRTTGDERARAAVMLAEFNIAAEDATAARNAGRAA